MAFVIAALRCDGFEGGWTMTKQIKQRADEAAQGITVLYEAAKAMRAILEQARADHPDWDHDEQLAALVFDDEEPGQ